MSDFNVGDVAGALDENVEEGLSFAGMDINVGDVAGALDENVEEGLSFAGMDLYCVTADGALEVVTALEVKNKVYYLNLEGNTLGARGAAAIGKALENHSELQKVIFKNIFRNRLLSDIEESMNHLVDGLIMAGAQLTVLDFSNNPLGPKGMAILNKLLYSPVCYTLQELNVTCCSLGPQGCKILNNGLIEGCLKSKASGTTLQLKVLKAGRNFFESEGAFELPFSLSTLGTLETIVISENSISPAGIDAIVEGIKLNPNLQVLDLNENTLTYTGVRYLIKAFPFTKDLRELLLSDCALKTRGALYLAEALTEDCNQLSVLDLSYNEFNLDAGLAVIEAMENKLNLQRLDLDGNEFGRKACKILETAARNLPNPDALCPLEDCYFIEDEEDEETEEEEEYEADETVYDL